MNRQGATIVLVVAILVAVGLVSVFSASSITAERYGDSFHFLKRQVIWIMLAMTAAIAVFSVDYLVLVRHSRLIILVALALLAATLVPGIGTKLNGARRWIRFGPIGLQPSEFAKLAVIIYLVDFLTRHEADLDTFWRGLVPPALVLGAVLLLVGIAPDVGTAALIGLLSFVMLFVAGLKARHMALLGMTFVPFAAYVALARFDHVMRRILAFIDPAHDPTGAGHHIIQSLIALGSGGLFGEGLGNSTQKLYFLPEAPTDFILAIIGEEMGFLGCAGIVLLFALLFRLGIQTANRARDRQGYFLAYGITFSIVTQAMIHVAVVSASAPTKGITLPFVSFGGSSLFFSMIGIGILTRVAREAREQGETEARPAATGAGLPPGHPALTGPA